VDGAEHDGVSYDAAGKPRFEVSGPLLKGGRMNVTSAQDFIIERTLHPAVDSVVTSARIKNLAKNSIRWIRKFKRTGDLIAYMDRFQGKAPPAIVCQNWHPAMICWGLGGFGVGLTGVLKVNTKEDMAENSRMIVLWGANIASQSNTARHIISARRRGAKVITIDVRRTEV